MQGIAGAAPAMRSAELAMQYQVRVISMQKNAIDQAGQEAVRLIQSATAGASAGHQIDIRV